MKRFSLLSEQDVLRKPDAPHPLRDKCMSFVAMRQRMDPETAQKALEQVPHLTQSLSEILGDFSQLIKAAYASNGEQAGAYFSIAGTTLEALQRQLDDPELSFEERCAVMDKMLAVNDQAAAQVTDGQKFSAGGQLVFGFVALLCVSAAAAILGASTTVWTARPKM